MNSSHSACSPVSSGSTFPPTLRAPPSWSRVSVAQLCPTRNQTWPLVPRQTLARAPGRASAPSLPPFTRFLRAAEETGRDVQNELHLERSLCWPQSRPPGTRSFGGLLLVKGFCPHSTFALVPLTVNKGCSDPSTVCAVCAVCVHGRVCMVCVGMYACACVLPTQQGLFLQLRRTFPACLPARKSPPRASQSQALPRPAGGGPPGAPLQTLSEEELMIQSTGEGQ